MPINFLYPDPRREKVMEELDKIAEILQRPKNPETKKNVRLLRNFTRSLFIISHKKPGLKTPQKTITPQPPSQAPPQAIPKKTLPPLPPPAPSREPTPLAKESTPSTEIKQNTVAQLKEEGGILKYNSVEPVMEPKDWQIYKGILPIIKTNLKKDPNIIDKPNFLINEIKKVTKELKIKFTPHYAQKIKHYLTKNLKGYGKIDPLIHDSRVKKIICNSADQIEVIFEDKKIPTSIKFDTNEELNSFILNLGGKYHKSPTEASPTIEIKLPKIEIKANYNPIMGSSFTITKL